MIKTLSFNYRDSLHASFASQLEAVGLWHWAVFVLLHLSNAGQRKALSKDVLGRHVIPSDEDSARREVFLQDRLGVPLPWIAEAKAVRASVNENYGDQVPL